MIQLDQLIAQTIAWISTSSVQTSWEEPEQRNTSCSSKIQHKNKVQKHNHKYNEESLHARVGLSPTFVLFVIAAADVSTVFWHATTHIARMRMQFYQLGEMKRIKMFSVKSLLSLRSWLNLFRTCDNLRLYSQGFQHFYLHITVYLQNSLYILRICEC